MKRFASLWLALTLMASLSACGGKEPGSNSDLLFLPETESEVADTLSSDKTESEVSETPSVVTPEEFRA